jgi:hypothetical protein
VGPIRIDPDAIYEEADLLLSFGISRTTLSGARREGRLPGVRRGRNTFYRGDRLLAWLSSDETSGSTAPSREEVRHVTP